MSFASALSAVDKKGILKSNDHTIFYPTGIAPLDYANGFWLDVLDKEHGGGLKQVPVLGVRGGSFVSVIGSTGSGKSTLADQIGFSIIKRFEDGMLFHIDAELTNIKQRMIQIMGCSPTDDRIRLKKDMISIDDVLDMFNMVCQVKESNGNLYKYKVENCTYSGDPFEAYVPTVFIIDSLPSFNPREFNCDDMGTNMDGARAAKEINRFYVNCMARMEKYNITIITINHIRPKVVADRFSAPPAGLQMLGQGEMVSRGYAAQYYSQNYFRCNSTKGNMYKPEEVGFTGIKNTIQIAKTKSSFIGATLDACFNSQIGYDPVYTLYEFAHSIGIIEGRNPYLYFAGLPDLKFNRKDFRHRFITEDIFRHSVMSVLTPYLEDLLGAKEVSNDDRIQFGDYEKMALQEQLMNDEDYEKELLEKMRDEKKTKKKAS